jgi:hypothetical protein
VPGLTRCEPCPVLRAAGRRLAATRLALELERTGQQEEIRRVLAHPTSLEIRGAYHTGPDEGALDTVVLRAGG